MSSSFQTALEIYSEHERKERRKILAAAREILTSEINKAIEWLKAANENLLVKIVVDTKFYKFPLG